MPGGNTFVISWLVTTLAAIWFMTQGQSGWGAPLTVTIVFTLTIYTTAAFLWWLSKTNLDDVSAVSKNRPGWFVVAVVGITAILFLSYWVARLNVLFALPMLGLVVLIVFRRGVRLREIVYALALGAIAGIAGLGSGINFAPPIVWAVLQFCLVLFSLPAGWSILRQCGLLQVGVGRSRFLSEGFASGWIGFGLGILICIPWMLSAVLLRPSNSGTWVQAWWQPLTVLQPAIAEEAWGRILLVPLVFVALRRFANAQTALIAAIIIVGYAFAYWHTSNDFYWFTILSMGTLTVLPVSFLCFYRDVETAIGFHFAFDFGTALIPFFLIQGF